jgi:hypothetical protein
MVSAEDIVRAAYELQGAPYRHWHPGDPIPMWRKDGVGDPPPSWHLQNVGVMGSDLINYALERNGLPPGGGTVTFANYLVRTLDFDPSTPGQMGAIAFRPYSGPAPYEQGHLALYVGAHQLIQALPGGRDFPWSESGGGVTDQYTDQQTYSWGSPMGFPQYGFTVYGFLPGVRY